MITLFTLLGYTCMSFANRGKDIKMGNYLFIENKVKSRWAVPQYDYLVYSVEIYLYKFCK
jgi:hypothetical protein